MQTNPFTLIFILCGVLMWGVAYYVCRHRQTPGTWPFFGLFTAIGIYMVGYGIELTMTGLEGMLMAIRVEYLGIALIAPLWLLFSIMYTGHQRWLTRTVMAAIWIVPAITLIAALTMPAHDLFYAKTAAVPTGSLVLLSIQPGPLYWLHIVYTAAAFIAGTALLGRLYLNSHPLFHRQVILVVLGACFPFMLLLVYLEWIITAYHFDLLPFAFIFAGLIATWALFRYRLLEISPVAREALFRAIPAGVIFIDDRSRIVDMNPAAEAILGIDASSVLGLQATEAISGWPEFQEYLESDPPDRMLDLPCYRDGTLRYYTIIRTPLPVHRERGAILIIQDITARKEAEQGMEIARTHIALLNSITRHDILNLVTGASGYLQLIQMDPSHPDVPRYLQNLESAINGIQREIEFTRDYQEMGTAPPEWQTVVPLVYSCLEKNPLDDEIDVEVDIPRTLAIYADPMLEKVFCNIIRNAGQHAAGMTRLRIFSIARQDAELVIVFEDDGPGVPDPEKSRIFEPTYKRRHGHGLFLVREILSITGLDIRETGTPGTGARFEIIVPPDRFRLSE